MYYAAIVKLSKYDGGVSDSGEGRWTVHAAVDLGVPAPVISSALYSRFESRRLGRFANKVLNGMRAMFGGHDVRLIQSVMADGCPGCMGSTTLCMCHHLFRAQKG